MKSMTAFASAEVQGEWGCACWEVRSVNHRYLELSYRLPEGFRALEADCRALLSRFLARGKVDCSLRLQPGAGLQPELQLNHPLIKQLLAAEKQLVNTYHCSSNLAALDILQWHDVIQTQAPDYSSINSVILDVLEQTLTQLVSQRQREGSQLKQFIKTRLQRINELTQEIGALVPTVNADLVTKLRKRINELTENYDENRLAQELAIATQKIDISEELDRIKAHAEEVEQCLQADKPVGRALDFLMQELHREANTMSAKTNDITASKLTLELKVVIDQMREQVQNIE